MAQLGNENLAAARTDHPPPRHRAQETGLRAGDAVVLPSTPSSTTASAGRACATNAGKTHAEQLTPLSCHRGQRRPSPTHEVLRRFPDGSPWLFPAPPTTPTAPCPTPTVCCNTDSTMADNDRPPRRTRRSVQVTSHQFRHTLGTRLINAGVPQHVVQRLLGHASPEMTGIYAHLHDDTVRQAFERYQATRVDITGQVLDFDPPPRPPPPNGSSTTSTRSGRPPQRLLRTATATGLPQPNACLTCPDFQTTVEFLDIHRRHANSTTVLIAAAEVKGDQRLAANHRRVHDNLTHIIDTLETVAATDDTATADDPR